MEDGSELLRHSQGLSIEEEWNKIDGPPIRQVTAIVIGLGNVSIFCDINGVIWCNYWILFDNWLDLHYVSFLIAWYQRGEGYASYSIDFPSRLKIVAIAEPLKHRYHYTILTIGNYIIENLFYECMLL